MLYIIIAIVAVLFIGAIILSIRGSMDGYGSSKDMD